MSAGSVTAAMTRTAPQRGQNRKSMSNTRRSRCIQLMGAGSQPVLDDGRTVRYHFAALADTARISARSSLWNAWTISRTSSSATPRSFSNMLPRSSVLSM